jgi:hypothetical protein
LTPQPTTSLTRDDIRRLFELLDAELAGDEKHLRPKTRLALEELLEGGPG